MYRCRLIAQIVETDLATPIRNPQPLPPSLPRPLGCAPLSQTEELISAPAEGSCMVRDDAPSAQPVTRLALLSPGLSGELDDL